MFEWLWKRLGGGGRGGSSAAAAAPAVAAAAHEPAAVSSEAVGAGADEDTTMMGADNDTANNDAKKEEDATDAVGGSSTMNEGGVTASTPQFHKEVTVIKTKPTVAKIKFIDSAGSSLTAVRTGNTRPSSDSAMMVTTTSTISTVLSTKLIKKVGATTGPADATAPGGCTSTEAFSDMLERLNRYKTKHGNCRVPATYKDDPTLANFVKNVRRQYKQTATVKGSSSASGVEESMTSNKKKTTTTSLLTLDQIRQLEQLDFVWELKRGRPAQHSNQ